MSKLTRSNIAYDFNISPHVLEVPYEKETLKFVFSSELYKTKFYETFYENRVKINASLSNRFGFEIVNDLLCDLKLYITIEKRGFLIIRDNGEKIEWLRDIILDGNRMMKRS